MLEYSTLKLDYGMKLFGTDGIRGEAGTYLSAELAMKVAMAAGIYFKSQAKTNKILVGKDTRISGYMIESAIVSGLTAVGYDVIQIGPMPTPAIAFITENMRCDAGIMISASHNPFQDNGIKFFDAHGDKLTHEIEEKIEEIYFNNDLVRFSQETFKNIGRAKRIDDVIGRYIVNLKNSFPLNMTLQGLRIVLDTAHGAAHKVGPTVLQELGADVIIINNNPDGYNINDDCGAMHTKDVQQTVLKYRADLGVALDGDADRLVVIDENGEVVDGDHVLGALGMYLHERKMLKGNSIVSTVMSNQGLDDYMSKHKIQVYRSAVGDKNVLDLMKEKGSNFGGEQSGHIIMHEYAKTGDGLVSALQVLALILSSGKKASEILRPFSLYPQKLVNVHVKEKKPLEEINGLDEVLKELEAKNIRHLIRYSGTEKKLRLLLEAKDITQINLEMEKLISFFHKALNA